MSHLNGVIASMAHQLNDRQTGFGTLNRPSRRDTVRIITVKLDRNRSFIINLDGIADIRGTWRRINDGEARLDIDRFGGLFNARGNGTVRLYREDQVRSLSVSGSSETGSFSLDWNSTEGGLGGSSGSGGWGGNRPEPPSNDEYLRPTEFNVDGDMRYDRDRLRLKKIKTTFSDDRGFSLEVLDGEGKRTRIEGDWSRSGTRALSIKVTRFDRRSARGSGTVRLDSSRRIEQIDLRGSTNRDRNFSLNADRIFARPR